MVNTTAPVVVEVTDEEGIPDVPVAYDLVEADGTAYTTTMNPDGSGNATVINPDGTSYTEEWTAPVVNGTVTTVTRTVVFSDGTTVTHTAEDDDLNSVYRRSRAMSIPGAGVETWSLQQWADESTDKNVSWPDGTTYVLHFDPVPQSGVVSGFSTLTPANEPEWHWEFAVNPDDSATGILSYGDGMTEFKFGNADHSGHAEVYDASGQLVGTYTWDEHGVRTGATGICAP